MANAVTHFEITGHDPESLQTFYSAAFGWDVAPAGPSYAMVHTRAGAGIDGGVGRAPEGTGDRRVTIYVEVDDVDAALGRITSLGGTTVTPPVDVPNGPTIALFRDPEGNLIGLTKASSIRR